MKQLYNTCVASCNCVSNTCDTLVCTASHQGSKFQMGKTYLSLRAGFLSMCGHVQITRSGSSSWSADELLQICVYAPVDVDALNERWPRSACSHMRITVSEDPKQHARLRDRDAFFKKFFADKTDVCLNSLSRPETADTGARALHGRGANINFNTLCWRAHTSFALCCQHQYQHRMVSHSSRYKRAG